MGDTKRNMKGKTVIQATILFAFSLRPLRLNQENLFERSLQSKGMGITFKWYHNPQLNEIIFK
jgi:hypothetical protein